MSFWLPMTLLDFGLLVMVVIWGSNFSVIKYALREFNPITFNVLRLALASGVFLAAIAVRTRLRPTPAPSALRRRRLESSLTRDEWKRIVVLGIVGHLLYQLAFLAGMARTTASNGALIFGATPVVVAILSSLVGHERIPLSHWVGAGLSVVGIYVVVGHRASLSNETLLGDALVFAGMICWSIYSVLAQPLLKCHSPLVVTGYSMAIGAALYLLVGVPALGTTRWDTISLASWVLMALSSLLALAFAYMVWYTAVQRIGSSRTAIYSNLTPIVALVIAAISLGERIDLAQIIGAATIVGGVFITRFASAPVPPPES